MTQFQKVSLFILRITLGWLYFYAGITKVLNSAWSAEGYIKGAKNFVGMYQYFLDPGILPIVNFMNKWGLLLLGISLIFGIFVRLSAVCGILLMLMYYFVILQYPHPSPQSYIVDQHIIYIAVLLYFIAVAAGRAWGVDGWLRRKWGRVKAFTLFG